jgi:Ca2+ transporting ATPase
LLIDDVTKYDDISKLKAPSQHFTLIFNAFVLMTLFNEINARKLNGERNVFEGIHKNPYFYVIWIICFAGQILIVNFGGIAFSVEPLELDHWAWCLMFGVGSLLWGQLVSLLPSSFLRRIFCKRKKSEEMQELKMIKSSSVSVDILKN